MKKSIEIQSLNAVWDWGLYAVFMVHSNGFHYFLMAFQGWFFLQQNFNGTPLISTISLSIQRERERESQIESLNALQPRSQWLSVANCSLCFFFDISPTNWISLKRVETAPQAAVRLPLNGKPRMPFSHAVRACWSESAWSVHQWWFKAQWAVPI